MSPTVGLICASAIRMRRILRRKDGGATETQRHRGSLLLRRMSAERRRIRNGFSSAALAVCSSRRGAGGKSRLCVSVSLCLCGSPVFAFTTGGLTEVLRPSRRLVDFAVGQGLFGAALAFGFAEFAEL